jgi:hypothetical protein
MSVVIDKDAAIAKRPLEIFRMDAPNEKHTVPDGTILLGYRGSIAHNMYVPNSDPNSIDDIDLMGVVIAPLECYFGLSEYGSRGTKEYKQGPYDCVYYEIRKAVSLLLQGNPNIVSLLWLRPEHYLSMTDAGRRLVAARELFTGKHAYNAFAGYAYAQLLKMETRDPAELRQYIAITGELKRRGKHPNSSESDPEREVHGPLEPFGEAADVFNWSDEKLLQGLRSFQKKGDNIGYLGDKRKKLVLEHGYDAKNAAHCIRLLRMCGEFMRTGIMNVYREADAGELLDIKRGKWELERVKAYAEELFADVKAARDASPLPDEPDRKAVIALLVDIVHTAVASR